MFLPPVRLGFDLPGAVKGIPESEGDSVAALPLDQNVAPVQIAMLKLAGLLRHSQRQGTL